MFVKRTLERKFSVVSTNFLCFQFFAFNFCQLVFWLIQYFSYLSILQTFIECLMTLLSHWFHFLEWLMASGYVYIKLFTICTKTPKKWNTIVKIFWFDKNFHNILPCLLLLLIFSSDKISYRWLTWFLFPHINVQRKYALYHLCLFNLQLRIFKNSIESQWWTSIRVAEIFPFLKLDK